jgi:glycosyltransferase involved in cell wall biosynthesis
MSRSFVIPALNLATDRSPDLRTLLTDLETIDGEVICIFNGREVYEELRSHPRIDRLCFNSSNAGVSRSWNIGMNLASGDVVFILDESLHVTRETIEALEGHLRQLPNAAIVGPAGSVLDFNKLEPVRAHKPGTFQAPRPVHAVWGFLQAIDLRAFRARGLAFDVNLSPAFYEEWDIGLQVLRAGLTCYAVPIVDFTHDFRLSAAASTEVIPDWPETKGQIMARNKAYLRGKWLPHIIAQCTRKFEKWQSLANK